MILRFSQHEFFASESLVNCFLSWVFFTCGYLFTYLETGSSLYSPGWPPVHHPSASSSGVLGLQASVGVTSLFAPPCPALLVL
jgi:hypothetical protein